MSDFLHLADKFKNKLGISSPQSTNQQGGYYPAQGTSSTPGYQPPNPGPPYNSYQPQYPAQHPWQNPSQPSPGFPNTPGPYSYYAPSDGSVPAWNSAPPPIPPRTGPPAIPERPAPPASREPGFGSVSDFGNASVGGPKASAPVGAIYAPGTYPTPDLFDFPLGKHTVLHSPVYGYTAKSIQHEIDQLGPTSTLYLPRGSRWEVESTITLHPYQELATEGYPTAEHEVAWLEATPDCHSHLISGFSKSGVRLRNLLIEGHREKYGHDPDGRCMIILGDANTCNQVS